ncbi:MAG: ribose-phosphate pyrophosphokinase [Lachnospiraceae bacterium]|nr:ribose-phosphate pyrophosphokinase [Lachnospiraceae bacterium]
MIQYNGEQIKIGYFPDNTFLLKKEVKEEKVEIKWFFERNEELVALYFLVQHLREHGVKEIQLQMPYIPNARQDRVKEPEDIFTLKYFASLINEMGFSKVTVLDPHSYVSEALIDRLEVQTPKKYVAKVIEKLETERHKQILLFFPDEGACKRYSTMFPRPYIFGMKKREWKTGEITGLEVLGETEEIAGRGVLIVDDICSRGGTFLHSARALKKLGAEEIYLYVSHCENTILEGELLKGDLLKKVYTTNSIFTKEHKKVEVLEYE